VRETYIDIGLIHDEVGQPALESLRCKEKSQLRFQIEETCSGNKTHFLGGSSCLVPKQRKMSIPVDRSWGEVRTEGFYVQLRLNLRSLFLLLDPPFQLRLLPL
jgi:hypothetical protein